MVSRHGGRRRHSPRYRRRLLKPSLSVPATPARLAQAASTQRASSTGSAFCARCCDRVCARSSEPAISSTLVIARCRRCCMSTPAHSGPAFRDRCAAPSAVCVSRDGRWRRTRARARCPPRSAPARAGRPSATRLLVARHRPAWRPAPIRPASVPAAPAAPPRWRRSGSPPAPLARCRAHQSPIR